VLDIYKTILTGVKKFFKLKLLFPGEFILVEEVLLCKITALKLFKMFGM
jgi:hypothetical protein